MTENTAPQITEVEAPAEAPEVDADEAAYQAEMAEIRANGSDPDEAEAEPEETEEDEEYREALNKAKGEKEEKSEAKKEKAEKKSEKEVWKLKVNNREVEVDPSDKDRVKQLVQKGLGADARLEEAYKIRSQSEAFVTNLRANPFTLLEHDGVLGKDGARKAAEEYLYKKIQHEQMTPEQRQAAEQAEALKKYRDKEEQEKLTSKQRQEEELKERYRQDWSKKFTEVMEKTGLPKTDFTVARMAQYMRQALKNGHTHIQPADVVDLVKEDYKNHLKQALQFSDGDKLLEVLGKENVDKIRKANLKKYDAAGGQERVRSTGAGSHGKKEQKTYGSIAEMQRDLKVR